MTGDPKVSGTFMLPPKPEHEALLVELEAATKRARFIQGRVVYPHQAKAVLALHDTLFDATLRDTLLSKPLAEMIAVTVRVHSIADSWSGRAAKRISG
jgi:hypothetical protein